MKFLAGDEVARLLGLRRSQLIRLIDGGHLRGLAVSKDHFVIAESELARFWAQHRPRAA